MTGYYAHPYVSNSDLTRLKIELEPSIARDFQDALKFGILFHALLLEPETVDHIRRSVQDNEYTLEDFNAAKKMRDAVKNDSFCNTLLQRCQKEVEMYHDSTEFIQDGISFTLPTKRKYDFWDSLNSWGGDFKSTTARTQQGFISAVQQFDYDRSRVFYAKGSGATRDVIIGVSKVYPHRIFPVFMRTGCPLWQSGEIKTNDLAYKYYNLKSLEYAGSQK